MRQSMKRIQLFLLATLIVLAFALVGCSNGASSSKKGVTTITFWNNATGTGKDALDAVIKQFNKTHSKIQVKSTYVASNESSDDKLLTAVTGGNPPDISLFDRFKVASWANQGSLTDLSEYAKKDGITKDKYYPFAWDESSYNGKLYAIPISTDARLLYYNKDEFKKAGLDPNKPPTTIDELEADADKLTIKKGSRFQQLGFAPWLGQGWLYTWGWAFGGDFYNKDTDKVTLDNPQVVKALQWEQDWAKTHNVEDITGFQDSAGSDAQDPFLTGQISMQVNVTGTVEQIKKFKPDLNYGVAPIPTPTGKDFTTWSGGFSLIIPKGAKHPKQAWEFLKYLGSPEGQKLYCGTSKGDLSVIDSVNQDLFKDDPIMMQFVDLLKTSHNRPSISQGQLLWNELDSAVDKAIHGKGDPKSLLEKANKKVNDALAKDKAN
ncbi:ABC transporter substrate-binding protein [Pullulanibacillus camelliae]|uniref:ABC transporter substrate-binding protein n=1 Tax=Pullulanibacillus camelliae TaxID=1707096 RepID=A0A8J2VMP5_9BACL|nr:ABC transporter substrate-binding protein [Pullulanibacillus camelliae]GGE31791.1 ABC transporter substrate-binding protein [Pullulanibacillus camelliae]